MKTYQKLTLLSASALFTVSALASENVEERLKKLEGEIGTLKKENQQLRSELGLEKTGAFSIAKAAGKESSLTLGGFLQAQAEFGDKGDARFTTNNNRFFLRRSRINIAGKFSEGFEFKMETDFTNSLSEGTAFRAQLTDAYIAWTKYDFASIRVGQFKTPFGFEQLASDPKLSTVERTLMNDRLTSGRQVGLQLGGDLAEKRVAYAIGIFNGSGVNTNANDNGKFLVAGRVSGVAWKSSEKGNDAKWTAGVNALASDDTALASQPSEFGFDVVPGGTKDNIFTGSRKGAGIDTQLHYGAFDVAAEYLRVRFEPTDVIPHSRFDADGWYLQVGYFVLPKELQGVLKYDHFNADTKVNNKATDTWTLGTNYYIKGDDLKLQANYLISDIDGVAKTNHKLILRLQTVF